MALDAIKAVGRTEAELDGAAGKEKLAVAALTREQLKNNANIVDVNDKELFGAIGVAKEALKKAVSDGGLKEKEVLAALLEATGETSSEEKEETQWLAAQLGIDLSKLSDSDEVFDAEDLNSVVETYEPSPEAAAKSRELLKFYEANKELMDQFFSLVWGKLTAKGANAEMIAISKDIESSLKAPKSTQQHKLAMALVSFVQDNAVTINKISVGTPTEDDVQALQAATKTLIKKIETDLELGLTPEPVAPEIPSGHLRGAEFVARLQTLNTLKDMIRADNINGETLKTGLSKKVSDALIAWQNLEPEATLPESVTDLKTAFPSAVKEFGVLQGLLSAKKEERDESKIATAIEALKTKLTSEINTLATQINGETVTTLRATTKSFIDTNAAVLIKAAPDFERDTEEYQQWLTALKEGKTTRGYMDYLKTVIMPSKTGFEGQAMNMRLVLGPLFAQLRKIFDQLNFTGKTQEEKDKEKKDRDALAARIQADTETARGLPEGSLALESQIQAVGTYLKGAGVVVAGLIEKNGALNLEGLKAYVLANGEGAGEKLEGFITNFKNQSDWGPKVLKVGLEFATLEALTNSELAGAGVVTIKGTYPDEKLTIKGQAFIYLNREKVGGVNRDVAIRKAIEGFLKFASTEDKAESVARAKKEFKPKFDEWVKGAKQNLGYANVLFEKLGLPELKKLVKLGKEQIRFEANQVVLVTQPEKRNGRRTTQQEVVQAFTYKDFNKESFMAVVKSILPKEEK